MSRVKIVCFVIAFGTGLIASESAMSQSLGATHKITVATDEVTRGDLALVLDAVSAVAEGAEVPRAARRLAAGATGEMGIQVRKRINDGVLTLDDGSLVVLAAEDVIEARYEGSPSPSPSPSTIRVGANIKFSCTQGGCRPVKILIQTGSGACRLIDMDVTPPTVTTVLCPISW